MEKTQFGDQPSNSHAVQPNLKQMDMPIDHPQESDQSTLQIQIHRRTDVHHPALPSQLPETTFATPCQWRKLLNPGLRLTGFEGILSAVLQSETEMGEIEGLDEAELQSVIDVLGRVRAFFDPAFTVPHH